MELIVVPPNAGTCVLELLETVVAAAASAGNDTELIRGFSLYIEDRAGGYLSRFFVHWRGQRARRQGLLASSIHNRTPSLLALPCRKR